MTDKLMNLNKISSIPGEGRLLSLDAPRGSKYFG